MVLENEFPVEELIEDIYADSNLSHILSIKTYYEKQWLERGIAIKYIRFKPIRDKSLIEPETDIEPDPYRSFKRDKRVG